MEPHIFLHSHFKNNYVNNNKNSPIWIIDITDYIKEINSDSNINKKDYGKNYYINENISKYLPDDTSLYVDKNNSSLDIIYIIKKNNKFYGLSSVSTIIKTYLFDKTIFDEKNADSIDKSRMVNLLPVANKEKSPYALFIECICCNTFLICLETFNVFADIKNAVKPNAKSVKLHNDIETKDVHHYFEKVFKKYNTNDMCDNHLYGVLTSLSEFKDICKTIGETDSFNNELIERDIPIAFDCENFEFEKSFVNYPCGYHVLDNGLPVLFINAGGDWEFPICYCLFWNGQNLRGYLPKKGNVYDAKRGSAYSGEFTNIEELKHGDKDAILKDVNENIKIK